MNKAFDNAAFALLCITLVLAPILSGTVHPYTYTLLFFCILLALLLVLRGQVRRDFQTGRPSFFWMKTGLNLLFVAFLSYLVFQILPMPRFLAGIISPEAIPAAVASQPPLQVVTSGEDTSGWVRLAPYAYPAGMSILRWVVYGSVFFGLVQILRTRRRVEAVILCILVPAALEGLVLVLQSVIDANPTGSFPAVRAEPPWVSDWYPQDTPPGAYLAMTICLAAAFWSVLAEQIPPPHPHMEERSLRTWLSELLSGRVPINKRPIVLLCGLFIGAGLFFSGSPWGMASALAGLLFMAVPVALRRGHGPLPVRGLRVLLLVLLLLAACTIYLEIRPRPPGIEGNKAGLAEKESLIRETRMLFWDFPATGLGLGGMNDAFSGFTYSEAGPAPHATAASTEWYRFLTEAGSAGVFVLVGGVLFFLLFVLRSWKNRQDPFAVFLGMLPLGVIVSAATFAFSGFSLRAPATLVVLAALVAVGFSALHIQRRKAAEKYLVPCYRWPLKYRGGVLLAAVLALLMWSITCTVRHLVAEGYFQTSIALSADRDRESTVTDLRGATRWDPGNAAYWYALAHNLREIRDGSPLSIVESQQDAGQTSPGEIVEALEQAAARNPLSAAYHQALGQEYSYLSRDPAHDRTWLPAADLAMDRAACFARGFNSGLQRNMGDYWLLRSKSLSPEDDAWEKALSKAGKHYRTALALQEEEDRPGMRPEIGAFIWNAYPDEGFRTRLLGE